MVPWLCAPVKLSMYRRILSSSRWCHERSDYRARTTFLHDRHVQLSICAARPYTPIDRYHSSKRKMMHFLEPPFALALPLQSWERERTQARFSRNSEAHKVSRNRAPSLPTPTPSSEARRQLCLCRGTAKLARTTQCPSSETLSKRNGSLARDFCPIR
jgi:hypothetical protein